MSWALKEGCFCAFSSQSNKRPLPGHGNQVKKFSLQNRACQTSVPDLLKPIKYADNALP